MPSTLKTILRFALNAVLVAGLLGLFGYTGWFLYKKSDAPPPAVELTGVFTADIEKSITIPGSLQPEEEINVKAQVSGVLEELFVKPGEFVTKGQKIARLRVIPEMTRLNEAEFEVRNNKTRLEQTQINYERTKKLVEQGALPRVDLQPLEAELALNQQNLERSETNLELIKEGVSKRSGQQFNIVYATASGTVLDVPNKVGANIIQSNNFNEGTTLASVADLRNMLFIGKANEADVSRIQKGMAAQLIIGALPNKKYMADLYFIAPKGKDNNGNIEFEIRARLVLPQGELLRAGYSANAKFTLDKREKTPAIKESAVFYKNEQPFVTVLQDSALQKFEDRAVKLGLSDAIHVELLEGLKPNERFKLNGGKIPQAEK